MVAPPPGVYIKREIHFFAPPSPFLIHIFPPKDINNNDVVRAAGEFFFDFVNFKPIKNIHTFYQLGGKYAFPPLFSSPFHHFFPTEGGGSNRKIYTSAPRLEPFI